MALVARGGFVAALATCLAACAGAPPIVSPVGPGGTVCGIGGCRDADVAGPPAAASACTLAGDAACAGASAEECADRALAAWSEAADEHAVACVARMLFEACGLDSARACSFAGRLALDGRGTARDPKRGLEMLIRACDGGVATACAVAAQWLGDAAHAKDIDDAANLVARIEGERSCLAGQGDSCFQVGVLFYYGRDGYPHDRPKAVQAFGRGCDLSEARFCNNLGDALTYGEGVGRDVEAASAAFLKACRLGEALGCANFGYMAERGEGVPRDVARARALYRQSCAAGEIYGCLHAEMMAAQDAGVSRDPDRALAQWTGACDRRDARACAFVGVIYDDGPDGMTRDEAKSQKAMSRACDLGETRACDWLKSHPDD